MANMITNSRGRIHFECSYCGRNFSTNGQAMAHEDDCPDKQIAIKEGRISQ